MSDCRAMPTLTTPFRIERRGTEYCAVTEDGTVLRTFARFELFWIWVFDACEVRYGGRVKSDPIFDTEDRIIYPTTQSLYRAIDQHRKIGISQFCYENPRYKLLKEVVA